MEKFQKQDEVADELAGISHEIAKLSSEVDSFLLKAHIVSSLAWWLIASLYSFLGPNPS